MSDTSVLIAQERSRPLARALPDAVAISVISIAELEVGVLVARDPQIRAQRLRTLGEVRSMVAALPIDERTASAYARHAASVLLTGRKPRIHDTWIAASALVNDTEVWAQDSDFSDFDGAITLVSM